MATQTAETIAFGRPGGEACATRGPRPIDLSHLSRQTLGDRKVEAEVLALFMQQAVAVRDRIGTVAGKDRVFLAHGLKGSAQGIGAFAVAESAGRIEADPDNSAEVSRLARRIDEVRSFLASINR